MDSNSIAQLIAAFKESQVAPSAISQNSVLIATMITALVGQMFIQWLGYLKSKSAEEHAKAASLKLDEASLKRDESDKELEKIHVAVNSGTEVGKVKIEGLEKKVLELLQEKATTDEKQRVQTAKDAIAAGPPHQSQPSSLTELSPSALAQIVRAIKEAKE